MPKTNTPRRPGRQRLPKAGALWGGPPPATVDFLKTHPPGDRRRIGAIGICGSGNPAIGAFTGKNAGNRFFIYSHLPAERKKRKNPVRQNQRRYRAVIHRGHFEKTMFNRE
jgi:hypothetical protein